MSRVADGDECSELALDAAERPRHRAEALQVTPRLSPDRANVAVEAISGAIWNQIWNHTALKSEIGHSGHSEVPDSVGGPSRTRTLDPLIKSQLLYQLS